MERSPSSPINSSGLAGLPAPTPTICWKTAREALAAARRSFGYVNTSDPRSLALSLALPLSAGSLMAEAMLRGLVFYSILGPKRFSKSTLDFIETTSDIAPFVRLQYKDLIERHLRRLENVPEDAATTAGTGKSLYEVRTAFGRRGTSAGCSTRSIRARRRRCTIPVSRIIAWESSR